MDLSSGRYFPFCPLALKGGSFGGRFFLGTPGMGGSQGVEVPPGPGRRDRSEPQGDGP